MRVRGDTGPGEDILGRARERLCNRRSRFAPGLLYILSINPACVLSVCIHDLKENTDEYACSNGLIQQEQIVLGRVVYVTGARGENLLMMSVSAMSACLRWRKL